MVRDIAVKGYLRNLVGDEGLEIVEKVPPGELTDEKIAEETGANLNTVRRTLYVLYENRLARYRRERDRDSGWLTYIWKVDFNDVERNLDEEAKELINRLEARVGFELHNVSYICENRCGRYLFDMASDYGFLCPVCNMSLDHQDNSVLVDTIERKISELRTAFE